MIISNPILKTSNANRPVSAKEYCYLELKEALLSARFRPGEQVTVKSLSESLGVGIMPVRESVQRLVAEGGLELLPNRMVRVAVLSRDEYSEIAEIRRLLEPLAVSKACSNATERDKDRIRDAWKFWNNSLDGGDSDEILFANKQLHFSLYQAARADHLFRLIELMWMKTGPMLAAPFDISSGSASVKTNNSNNFHLTSETRAIHKELCDLVIAGNAEQGVKVLQIILQEAADWYMNYYPFEKSS